MRFETVFDTHSSEPAGAGVGPLEGDAGKVQEGIALHPATAELAIDKPAILHKADATGNRSNPVLAHRAERRSGKRGMSKSCPVEITFHAEQKMAGLEIVAGLNATDEFGQPAIQIVARNVQAAAGPPATDIYASIKP